MMDPNGLIAPVNELGYPAPFWFLIFFRVLGFTLHLLPMNLWYAGTITAMLLGLSRVPEARRAEVLAHAVARLEATLRDEQGRDVADYTRLRFRAHKPR